MVRSGRGGVHTVKRLSPSAAARSERERVNNGAALGLAVLLASSSGCAAHPLDVPTGGLPMKCATFARPGGIVLNFTCSASDTDKPKSGEAAKPARSEERRVGKESR